MPKWDAAKGTSVDTETRKTYLWQCLMHSSHRILDDQIATFSRFKRGKFEIEQALLHGDTYPWAALTRLQAPKFFSDMIESLLGAVYLDCGGDMEVIRSVLERLGILPILRRVVSDDVDVRHQPHSLRLTEGPIGLRGSKATLHGSPYIESIIHAPLLS